MRFAFAQINCSSPRSAILVSTVSITKYKVAEEVRAKEDDNELYFTDHEIPRPCCIPCRLTAYMYSE